MDDPRQKEGGRLSPRISGPGSSREARGGEGGVGGVAVPKLKLESAIDVAGSHEFSQDADG